MAAARDGLTNEEKELLAAAAEWRLLGLLFECPTEDWRKQVAVLAREVKDAGLRDAAEAALSQASEAGYHSLFGPGGPVPAREAGYRSTIQLGYLLSELSAYYHAFGYQPRTKEACDHISVEIGFLAYLKLKEAYALKCGDHEGASVAADACRQFTSEHVAAVASPLARALEGIDIPYLAAAGRALRQGTGSLPEPEDSAFAVLNDDGEAELNCDS
jgi:nitrate reductase assembly molybdenum cofactor insertion protein NarJ